MIKATRQAALVAATLLFSFGCAAPIGPGAPVPAAVQAGTVKVRGHVARPDGGRRVLAIENDYDASDVASIEVFLKADGDAEWRSLGAVAGVDAPIELANLKMDTQYYVRLEAYATVEGEDVRIDADDEACVTSVRTYFDDEITDQAFNLKLMTRYFAGEASGSADVTPGDVDDATASDVTITEAGAEAPALPDASTFAFPVFYRFGTSGTYQLGEFITVVTSNPGCIHAIDDGTLPAQNGATIVPVAKVTFTCLI